MYALILQSEQRVEVLGFVHYGGALRAVYRDDEGIVSDIDVAGIRMEPNTGSEPDPIVCSFCGESYQLGDGHEHGYEIVNVPVVDGFATLPDGRRIASDAHIVRVPVLT